MFSFITCLEANHLIFLFLQSGGCQYCYKEEALQNTDDSSNDRKRFSVDPGWSFHVFTILFPSPEYAWRLPSSLWVQWCSQRFCRFSGSFFAIFIGKLLLLLILSWDVRRMGRYLLKVPSILETNDDISIGNEKHPDQKALILSRLLQTYQCVPLHFLFSLKFLNFVGMIPFCSCSRSR